MAAVALMVRLHSVYLALPSSSKTARSQVDEDEMFVVLWRGLEPPAFICLPTVIAFIDALAKTCVSKYSRHGASASPRVPAECTDRVVGALSTLLPRHAASTALACACANALKVFAGSCGDDDTAAPGSRALHAGALPLLELMLPAVEAELAGGVVDKAKRKLLSTVTEFVHTLREVKARREALLAELLADDKSEPARRAKSRKPTAAKTKHSPRGTASAATAAAAEVQPPSADVDQAAAAFGAVSIADAAPAAAPAAEPAPPVEATLARPTESEPVATTPPPLPQWLLQAVQRPTVPPPPPPAAPPPAALLHHHLPQGLRLYRLPCRLPPRLLRHAARGHSGRRRLPSHSSRRLPQRRRSGGSLPRCLLSCRAGICLRRRRPANRLRARGAAAAPPFQGCRPGRCRASRSAPYA